MAAANGLIPGDVRARLTDLRLAARQTLGGSGFGQHHSRSRGAGLEFAQYRSYEPGDDLRLIDWKLYGRSDRFFVREAERDSPLMVWLLIDATASMAQTDAARPDWSRLDAAKTMAACLVELALRQGDRFGLAAIRGDGLRVVPAGVGPRQRDQCVLALHTLGASGAWPDQARLRPLWDRIGAGALVVMLGDLFDDGCVALLERLAAARRDVSAIQLLTAEERDFPFRGGHAFVDSENEAVVLADGASARRDYLARLAAAQLALTQRLGAAGVRFASHVLDQPVDAPLRRLFPARVGRRAAEPV